jgi:sialate O-acetylesterase
MVLTFDHATGLKPSSGDLTGFAIAGSDKKFVWANAKIDHDQVTVWSDEVKEPASVRYGWSSHPKGNLVNGANLPASPFRTDDWDTN